MRKPALLLSIACLAACAKEPAARSAGAAPATTAGQAQEASAGQAGSGADKNRLLAFMKPGGATAVDKSIEALQTMIERQPDKLEAWVALGNAWILKARDTQRPSLYLNAGACADSVLARQPINRPALALKGLVLMNDHRFEEARALMAGTLQRTPDDPVAWGTISDAQLELGQTKEAVASAQRMMDIKPNLPSYSRAAHLQWLHGDVAAARESIRLAIDAGTDGRDKEPRAWVIVQAAMMFWQEGDADGAEAGFDSALTWLPGFAPAQVGKARVLLGRGDGASAAKLLEQAYKTIPLIETGWLLGDAREVAGDAAGAAKIRGELARWGRATDPRTLALFWATKNIESDSALELASEERKTRDDQYTEDVYAWALYRKGRLDEALAASEKANALGTRDARLWYHAGAIRLAKGDVKRGRELIQKALQLNPKFDLTGAAEARKLLETKVSAAR